MNWFLANLGLIADLSLNHLRLSLLPIIFGFFLSIPIGRFGARGTRAGKLVLVAVGLLYTIPSLALFVILPPLLGIGFLSELNVIIALTLYAAAIMVRSASDAFTNLTADIIRDADAIGFDRTRRFFEVELPIAGPVLLAGLRVVAVSTISMVTVGALVGVQSLGFLFTDGFQRRIIAEILVGVLGTMILVLLVDAILVLLGRFLMPWQTVELATRRQGA